MRPEDYLLVSCARIHRDPENEERIRTLLRSQIDWEYLLRAADSHGLKPLLYWHLEATSPESVPEVTLEHLEAEFRRNMKRNLFLSMELLKLLERLEGQGIQAIPFKGPVLAVSVYGNLALRPFSDLDILVHEGQRAPLPTARRTHRDCEGRCKYLV